MQLRYGLLAELVAVPGKGDALAAYTFLQVSGGRGISNPRGMSPPLMVFKSMCDSVFTSAVTWVFSGCVHRAAHAHPVYVPCVLCGGVRVIFPPEPDAPPGGVKDQLPVDAGPRFADPVHRLLADELQRPGRGQRPPLKQLRVRGAAATARLQDRPRGSKSPRGLPLMAVRPSENRTLTGKSPGSLPRRLRISGAGSSSRPGVPGRMRRARKNSNPPA